jgi:DNA-binding MarR family transcriptional regulator
MPLRLIPSIHRVTHQIGLLLERASDLRITQAEAHILAHLAEHGASTVAELHRGLAHKRSTLTSILDRLTARALVTREVSARDRRSFVIALTADGRRLARRVLASLKALEAAATADHSGAEVLSLQALLARLESSAAEQAGAAEQSE